MNWTDYLGKSLCCIGEDHKMSRRFEIYNYQYAAFRNVLSLMIGNWQQSIKAPFTDDQYCGKWSHVMASSYLDNLQCILNTFVTKKKKPFAFNTLKHLNGPWKRCHAEYIWNADSVRYLSCRTSTHILQMRTILLLLICWLLPTCRREFAWYWWKV